MRTSKNKMNATLEKAIRKTFAQALTDFKDPAEMEKFLESFFIGAELITYAKRLSIAYWLSKGRSYENIKTNLKASSATIAQVRVLTNKDGVKLALKKMEAEEWANEWAEKIKKFIK